MEQAVLKPEEGQLRASLLVWRIPFAIVLVILVAILLGGIIGRVAELMIGSLVALAVWCIIMIPIRLWIAAYWRSISYMVDEKHMRSGYGVFWRHMVAVPYEKITNVDTSQGPLQRLYGVGTVDVQTAGASLSAEAELRLWGVKDTEEVKETILSRVRSRAEEVPETETGAAEAPGEKATLRDILEELQAIRRALEKSENRG